MVCVEVGPDAMIYKRLLYSHRHRPMCEKGERTRDADADDDVLLRGLDGDGRGEERVGGGRRDLGLVVVHRGSGRGVHLDKGWGGAERGEREGVRGEGRREKAGREQQESTGASRADVHPCVLSYGYGYSLKSCVSVFCVVPSLVFPSQNWE